MKGIVLAGGSGTRLSPLTRVLSKQLLPIYDKPMIYYPLSVLMLAGLREILMISTPRDLPLFERLLGSGEELGMRFCYAPQPTANGLAEALIIGREFVGDDQVALIVGDNIFYGRGLSALLQQARAELDGAALFGQRVRDPERFGVAEIDAAGRLVAIEEKPQAPKSPFAITGLYFYDNDVLDIANSIKPSTRGELEITDVNNVYIEQGRAKLFQLGRGFAWLDTGTQDSLLEAGHYVQALQRQQGMSIACLEEVACRMGFISAEQLRQLARPFGDSVYGRYLRDVANELKSSAETRGR